MLYAMQADSMSRFFAITVTDNGAVWTPPDGAAWTVRFGAAGMPAGWYDTITEPGGGTHAAIVVDENTATVEIAEQAISTPGQNILCVLVTNAQGYQIASWPFLLNVQAVPGLEAPEATVYYNALTAQVAQTLANAQAAAASASAAATSAQEAQEAVASIDTANLVSAVGASAGQYPQATGSGYQWVEITAAGIGAAPEANGVTAYTCATSGTVHALTGTGNNIKFVADAAFSAGDTVTVNGQSVTAQTQNGEALTDGFWASGAVVGCYLNGTVLNFKGGGGINPSKATATPDKVLAPATFFAGKREIQTGVMVDFSGVPLAASPSVDGSNVNFAPQFAGYVDEATKAQASYSDVASVIGLTADKIMAGNTILDVVGTGGPDFFAMWLMNRSGVAGSSPKNIYTDDKSTHCTMGDGCTEKDGVFTFVSAGKCTLRIYHSVGYYGSSFDVQKNGESVVSSAERYDETITFDVLAGDTLQFLGRQGGAEWTFYAVFAFSAAEYPPVTSVFYNG